jgi:hypothetical protein
MTATAMTLHADFLNAWDQATMRALVDNCIHKNTACEDVSDKRLPPGMTLPAPTTALTPAGPATTTRAIPSPAAPATTFATSAAAMNPASRLSTVVQTSTSRSSIVAEGVDDSMSAMGTADGSAPRRGAVAIICTLLGLS